MPPHLHPRSRLTTSLFTGTLAVSFLVVGMPHLLPCPVPQRAFADGPSASDPAKRRRRRRKSEDGVAAEGVQHGEGGEQLDTLLKDEAKRTRGCPVPKPTGLVGQILGFPDRKGNEVPLVRIEKFSERNGTSAGEGNGR